MTMGEIKNNERLHQVHSTRKYFKRGISYSCKTTLGFGIFKINFTQNYVLK